MTESEWRMSSEPAAMLAWLAKQGRLSDRKARLYAVALCRRIWPLLTDERSRRAVEVAEKYADGQATVTELRIAHLEAWDSVKDLDEAEDVPPEDVYTADAAYGVAFPEALDAAGEVAEFTLRLIGDDAQMGQCNFIRNLFNPFRPAPFNPAWRTEAVLAAAHLAYDDRLPNGELRPERMAELARLLSESGCTDAELLRHLQGEGPFWRGDWALDVLLSKE